MVYASSVITKLSLAQLIFRHDKVVTFCQYHKINVDRLKEDLAASAFVVNPSDDIDTLYEQYISSFSDHIHAPLKMRRLTKPAPGWISNQFRTAKCLRRQHEQTWRSDKSQVNHARHRQQINRCNHLLNKNKRQYYQELVKENSGDGKKLWRALSKYHFYADDSQLFVHLSPGNCANSFHQLKVCLDDIHIWMFENKLKLNSGKTEFIVFGSMDKYKWLKDSFPVNILGNCLSPKDVVRSLGVLFDSKFSFTNHVNCVIKSCVANLQDLHRI